MPSTCPKCHKTFRGKAVCAHIMYCTAGLTWQDLYWEKVDKTGPGGCWLWKGALEGAGYGHYRVSNKDRRAHHLALELVGRTIPKGMSVMHTCDVRNCVNPDHLRLGSHAENMADCMGKRRHVHGERSIHAKLTAAQVLEIRARYKRTLGRNGHTISSNVLALAAEYGVNRGTIKHAALGYTWRYVK